MAFTLDDGLKPYATPRQWEVLTALAEHGSGQKAANALGVDKSLVNRVKQVVERKAALHGYAPDHDMRNPVPEGFKVGRISTLRDMQTGDARLQWQIAVPDREREEEKLQAIVEGLKGDLPTFKRSPKPEIKTSAGLLNLVPMGDPHCGMLAWAKEVGNDFDLPIFKRDLCAAVDYLVSQAPPADRCVIANMGDFFHIDNLDGVTPANKHALDQDSRLPKVIEVGVVALRQAIATGLTRHKIVEVLNCRANHDPVLGLALSVLLSHVYENEPRVVVHSQPTFRHYIRHGKVLLGFVHGHQTKDRDLPGIMATERAEDWGQTKHRTFFRGHDHQDSVEEFNGCKVEHVRTLAPGDAYANGAGFLSGRDMKLITFHAEYGERARLTCGIDLLRSLQ